MSFRMELCSWVIILTIFQASLSDIVKSGSQEISATFRIEDGQDFTKINYFADYATDEVFVGGRDALYRLKLGNLSLVEQVWWKSNASVQALCVGKAVDRGMTECRNYITVMLKGSGDSLFVCGSNAFSPECVWRKAGDLAQVTRHDGGLRKSPNSKQDSVAAFITEDGDQYFGLNIGTFTNRLPVLNRHSSSRPFLRTPDIGKNWLNDAQFVEMFENGPFIYTLFREESVEYLEKLNTKKPVYSRIARVCKNDVGGGKGEWTTFQKARLECPSYASSGESSYAAAGSAFLFDQLEEAVVLWNATISSTQKTIAGIFNAPGNDIYGAAVCLYDMATVQRAFQGSYQHQPQLNSTWLKTKNDLPLFSCEVNAEKGNITVRDLPSARTYQLMFDSVQPLFRKAIIIEEMTLFRLLAAEQVQFDQNRLFYVFYVLTDQKDIRKYVLDTSQNHNNQACLVHVWSGLFDPLEDVLTMTLIQHEQALVIGTSNRVIRLSTLACRRHLTKRECMESGDPHCGWSSNEQICSGSISKQDSSPVDWMRAMSATSCSTDNYFDSWEISPWYHCEDQWSKEQCFCRKRRCRSYKCSLVDEQPYQITNCSRNGNWTEFSDWSSCSVPCGNGVRSRFRTCSNPAPQFGGRDCEGVANQTEICQLADCPRHLQRSFSPPLTILGSQLQDWGPWGDCTKSCGGGIQRRARACMLDAAKTQCDSPQTEVRECNIEECPSLKRVSEWSKWVAAPSAQAHETDNEESKGGFHEHRYRCVGLVHPAKTSQEQLQLDITIKHEERYCPAADACHSNRLYDNALRSTWTSWSKCDETSLQYRFQNCQGSQQRVCSNSGKNGDEDHPWGCWSEWSSCHNSQQNRFRACLLDSKTCTRGETVQEDRLCKSDYDSNLVVAGSLAPPGGPSWTYLIIGCAISFFAGMGVVAALIFFRRNKESVAIHQRHLSQQNPYAATSKHGNLANGSVLYAVHGEVSVIDEDVQQDEQRSFIRESSNSPAADSGLSRHYSVKSNSGHRDGSHRQDSFRHRAGTDDKLYS